MKKVLFSIAIAAAGLLVASCGRTNQRHNILEQRT